MNIRTANSRTAWEAFIGEARPPTFLQSWAWGETQRALGEEVIRLELLKGDQTVGIVQAVTVTARRGKFLHVPHGPVTAEGSDAIVALFEALRREVDKRRLAFLRVSPLQEDTTENRALYRQLGFRRAPIHVHAERLWVLPLAQSETELLIGMRKTTRNLVRRAEREGVTVRLTARREDLPMFLRLYEETADREHFVPFSVHALETEFTTFAADGKVLLAIAEYQRQPLAAAMILFTPWSAFYHHGASSRVHPQIPAAVALHWAAIREAKRRGCAEYNFWGITPTSRVGRWEKHPWSGITLFKTGFGGREVPLVQTQDFPFTNRYWLAYVVDSLRRWKRRI